MTTFAPTDDNQHDLLALVADPDHPVGADAPALFLAACEADAKVHGYVSVLRVRERLADAQIAPQRLASFWSRFTGQDRPMRRIRGEWDEDQGGTTRNAGKVYPRRQWIGVPA